MVLNRQSISAGFNINFFFFILWWLVRCDRFCEKEQNCIYHLSPYFTDVCVWIVDRVKNCRFKEPAGFWWHFDPLSLWASPLINDLTAWPAEVKSCNAQRPTAINTPILLSQYTGRDHRATSHRFWAVSDDWIFPT